MAGDTCTIAQTVHVGCKNQTVGGGNTQPNPPVSGNTGDNNGWPWPWPPVIFCPVIGRVFTQALLLAVVALLVGVALLNFALVTGALTAIGVAFAVFFGIWTFFCQPHRCYVLGAILWVMKRATIVALVLLVLAPSLAILAALWIIGATAGVLTGWMRKRRCPIPSLRTPMNQLPVW